MQTRYFTPKNWDTQIQPKAHDSHSSIVSRIIKAFAMNSFFVYFSPSFQCLIYSSYWTSLLTIF